MQTVTPLLIGIALAAACGFRLFLPLLVMGIAHQSGHLTLAPGLEWVGSWPAVAAFAVATAMEILAYYVPWIDNLLDSIATPAAFVAGTLAAAASVGQIQGLSPLMTWTIAAITGGTTATVVQGGTVLVRAASSLSTGGVGNSIVATGEAVASVAISALAVTLPIVAGLLLLGMAMLVVLFVIRRRRDARRRWGILGDVRPAPRATGN